MPADPAALRDLVENQPDPSDKNSVEMWHQRCLAVLRVALGADHATTRRLTVVQYRPMSIYPGDVVDYAAERAEGIRNAVSLLEGAIHEVDLLQPTPPQADTAGLHPWVQGAAAGLWDDGHYRQAVDDATRFIDMKTQSKLGVDLSGTDLMTQAFNIADPTDTNPRLRFPQYEPGTRAWTNAHEGAMHFGRGCMMRIRNLIEHHDEIGKQEALESLAALSLLARWIDDAVVHTAADDTS